MHEHMHTLYRCIRMIVLSTRSPSPEEVGYGEEMGELQNTPSLFTPTPTSTPTGRERLALACLESIAASPSGLTSLAALSPCSC